MLLLEEAWRFVRDLNERAAEGERTAGALLKQAAPKLTRVSFDDV